jgi:hypothetical protein
MGGGADIVGREGAVVEALRAVRLPQRTQVDGHAAGVAHLRRGQTQPGLEQREHAQPPHHRAGEVILG